MEEFIIQKLEKLTIVDAYIFNFYLQELKQNTLHLLPKKVGSKFHLDLLKGAASKDPSLANVSRDLDTITPPTFHRRSNTVATIAAEAIVYDIDPK
eukprot:12039746-Ditylum_brightwellii.AAC.1